MLHSVHSRDASRFKESRTELGDGVDVKSEFKREIESDSNELLGLSNQVFSKGEIGSGKVRNQKFSFNHVRFEVSICHQ